MQDFALFITSLALLLTAARYFVVGISAIATSFSLSEAVIGLTIISLGTIALGNVVGSNIFNLLCVGGLVGVIRPVHIPDGGQQDLLFTANARSPAAKAHSYFSAFSPISLDASSRQNEPNPPPAAHYG